MSDERSALTLDERIGVLETALTNAKSVEGEWGHSAADDADQAMIGAWLAELREEARAVVLAGG